MDHLRLVTSRALLASLLVIGIGVAPMARADSTLLATLSGASEVPPVKTTANGTVSLMLNPGNNLLTWTVTYTSLSGPVTAAHLHGPAMAGQNAGVVVPFSGSLVSPISGSATLTPAQVADLMAGKWYVNLHTALNPGGEIRGQVMVRP